jgi:hypothetical protein
LTDVDDVVGDDAETDPAVHSDLALQLSYLKASESMGNHDSEIVDAGSVD